MQGFEKKRDIDKFLTFVFKSFEERELFDTLEQSREQEGYKCPSASTLAMHMIMDLYSDASPIEANINRISINLEAAADDLVHLSKLIRSLS